jgi:hypothetical protein
MEAITWIERITDETNPWLTANMKEDEHDYLQAVTLYLKDAGECLSQNALVKAALSCSCAADCLAKIGQSYYAQVLYSETAHLYLENADSIIGKSVRESVWSLREAHEYFLLAEDKLGARQAYDRFIHLASRVDPNVGNQEMNKLPHPKQSIRGGNGGNTNREEFPLDNSTDLAESLERFLLLRRSQHGPENEPAKSRAMAPDRTRGPINEESIISQLG